VTTLGGVSARLGGWGPNVTRTLTSVRLALRVPQPIRRVRTPPGRIGVSVIQATMKPHPAAAQVCIGSQGKSFSKAAKRYN
jgi:hypothetical protein